jgi:glutaredoxin-like protein NrdH
MTTPAVVVYTKNDCFGCDKTKSVLDRERAEYTAVNVEDDAAAYKYVTETLNFRQMPVVVVSTPDGDEVWSGLQPQMIKKHITPTGEHHERAGHIVDIDADESRSFRFAPRYDGAATTSKWQSRIYFRGPMTTDGRCNQRCDEP